MIKGYCEHCGKTRKYDLNKYEIDDYTKCKFCHKQGNIKEV